MGAPILIEFNGKIACVSEHCRDLGVSCSTLISRKKSTGESDLECLEYFQKYGVRHKSKYKVKDKRLYKRWYNAKNRCENLKNPHYSRYGGRGIKVCERWQNYENFEVDMLESFLAHVEKFGLKDTQLDRVNYDGNYEPSNCEWKTQKEQQNNRSNNRMVTDGLNVTQFAEKYRLSPRLVNQRLNRGMSVDEILDVPIRQHVMYYLPCKNNTVSLTEHCKQNSYNYNKIIKYIKQYNLTPDRALAKYLKKRNKK